jgi:hypothetical protein
MQFTINYTSNKLFKTKQKQAKETLTGHGGICL